MTIKNYQKNLDKDITNFISELQKKFPDVVITSGFRENAVTKFGKKSRHSTGEAVDIRINPEISDWLYNTKEGLNTLNKYGLGILDESEKENQKFGNAIHAGKDIVLVERARSRYKELFGYDYGQEPVQTQEEIIYELPSKSTTIVNNLPKSEESINFAEQISKLEQDNLNKQAELEKAYEQVNNSFQYRQPNQEKQVVYEEQTPNVNYEDIFNQVSQFVDTPIAQQGLKQLPKFDINKYLKNKEIKNLKEVPKEVLRESTQTSFINEKGKQVNTNPNPQITTKYNKELQKKQEIKDRRDRIKESELAKNIPYTSDNWREVLAKESQAIGDKLRISEEPNFFDDYLNPAVMVGSMASNLGQAPYQAEQTDSYLPYVTSIGTPLATGALAGLGAPTTKQFVNNLANPLTGTGEIVDKLGNKYLPNAYKYNPWAFKPNPEAYYRQVFGKEAAKSPIITKTMHVNNDPKGIKAFIEAKPYGFYKKNSDEIFYDLELPFTSLSSNDALPYFNKSRPYYSDNFFKGKPEEILIETNFSAKDYEDFYPGSMRIVSPDPNNEGIKRFGDVRVLSPFSKEGHNLENYNIYKKDWLKGYKEISKPPSSFKSEINWENWNKEIPENTQLMDEYNAIEQTSKANGTWMKNSDGSPFQGTPEQFVQQNSSKQQGGIIDDNMGQWKYPGEITRISSPNITMKDVPYQVLGIADTGEVKLMLPNQEYYFNNASTVTEYPLISESKKKYLKKLKNG